MEDFEYRWIQPMPRGSPRMRTEDGSKNQIGSRVRERRMALDMTRDALTGRIAYVTNGMWNPSLQEVLHIENGGRFVSDLEILALGNALECKASWLLEG